MIASISYQEFADYIEKHYYIRPELKMIDYNSAELFYSPSKWMPAVKVTINILLVTPHDITITYECSKLVNFMIEGGIKLLNEKIAKDCIDISTEHKRVRIHLNKIDSLKTLLSYLTLENIRFDETCIKAELRIN